MQNLPKSLLDALVDCGRYTSFGNVYWWRQAAMRKLEVLGLVEAWHPEGKITKRPAHRLTQAGRDMLY